MKANNIPDLKNYYSELESKQELVSIALKYRFYTMDELFDYDFGQFFSIEEINKLKIIVKKAYRNFFNSISTNDREISFLFLFDCVVYSVNYPSDNSFKSEENWTILLRFGKINTLSVEGFTPQIISGMIQTFVANRSLSLQALIALNSRFHGNDFSEPLLPAFQTIIQNF